MEVALVDLYESHHRCGPWESNLPCKSSDLLGCENIFGITLWHFDGRRENPKKNSTVEFFHSNRRLGTAIQERIGAEKPVSFAGDGLAGGHPFGLMAYRPREPAYLALHKRVLVICFHWVSSRAATHRCWPPQLCERNDQYDDKITGRGTRAAISAWGHLTKANLEFSH